MTIKEIKQAVIKYSAYLVLAILGISCAPSKKSPVYTTTFDTYTKENQNKLYTVTYLNPPPSKYIEKLSTAELQNKLNSVKPPSKYIEKYEKLSTAELQNEENKLLKELNYLKFEYYLKNIEKGKSRYSLAAVSDKKLKSLMEIAPNDEIYYKEWKDAVKLFVEFEDTNSLKIKEHRKKYKTQFDTKKERDSYYEEYSKLSKILKREKFEDYTNFHDNFDSKLNSMWLNRGRYLLKYYKDKNLLLPTDFLKYQDYEGLEKDENYSDLTERVKVIREMIKK